MAMSLYRIGEHLNGIEYVSLGFFVSRVNFEAPTSAKGRQQPAKTVPNYPAVTKETLKKGSHLVK